ncbi:MAG: hypothetical protein AB8C46_21165 [Burkholderiaceae bacterium]
MNENQARDDEHDTVFAELSWYANGTLPDSLADRVDKHLVNCAICQNELQLLRKTYESVNVESASQEQVDQAFARMSQRIDTYEAQLLAAGNSAVENTSVGNTADQTAGSQSGAIAQWVERLRQMLLGSGASWMPAASLAAVVLVSLVSVQMIWAPASNEYSVFTSGDPASLTLRVRFKEAVKPAAVIQRVQAMDISASVQTVDDRVYLVTLPADAAFPELNRAFEQFNASPDVQTVEAVLRPAK